MSMNSESIHSLLHHHVPPAAVAYCQALWRAYRFDFALRKNRISKIGDFSFRPGKPPQITVNRDLHPYLFLITYIHEVAHLEVHLRVGHRTEAHGEEWKNEFRRLLAPVMVEDNFPSDLLGVLRQHMENPRATTFSDAILMQVFRKYDPRASAMTFLSDIPGGSLFELHGRWFVKGETKRTRVLCHEVKTKKKYWVPAQAEICNVQLSLL